jgi:hypothetical protein
MYQNLDNLLLEPIHNVPLLLEEIFPLVLQLANLIQLCLHQLRDLANHRQLHMYQVHHQVFQRWDHHQEVLLKEVLALDKVLLLHPEVTTLVKEVMRLKLQILEAQLLHLLVE